MKLRYITTCFNACYESGHIGHYQRDCLYCHGDDDDDTSTPVIGQMDHILTADYPITETVLKQFPNGNVTIYTLQLALSQHLLLQSGKPSCSKYNS